MHGYSVPMDGRADLGPAAESILKSHQDAIDARFGLAHTMYEALAKQIDAFQKDLAADQEVGACLAMFGQAITITLTEIGYQNPHVMIFYGVAPDGKEVTLLQHPSQVNLLLVPVGVIGRPGRRLGFDL